MASIRMARRSGRSMGRLKNRESWEEDKRDGGQAKEARVSSETSRGGAQQPPRVIYPRSCGEREVPNSS